MYTFIIRLSLRLVFVLFSVFFGMQLFAQTSKELRHCTTPEYTMDLNILLVQKKIKYNDSLTYYWFKSQKVHNTQGRSSGNLLHGNYSKFYLSGQLAEEGVFKYGLKVGEWMTWHENGKLQAVFNYNSGVLHGDFMVFNEQGVLVETGAFKKGTKRIEKAKEVHEEKELDPEKEPWFEKLFKKDKAERLEKREENKRKRAAAKEEKKD